MNRSRRISKLKRALMSALILEFLLLASMPPPASAGLFDSVQVVEGGVQAGLVTAMMGIGLPLKMVDSDGLNPATACGDGGYVLNAEEAATLVKAKAKISKVVILMLENRSFDHYLSEINNYKAASARKPAFKATAPAGKPDPAAAAVAPADWTVEKIRRHKAPLPCTTDLGHEWWAIHRGWNYGRMDKFVTTTQFYMNKGQPNPMANEIELRRAESSFLKESMAAFAKVFREKNAPNGGVDAANAALAVAVKAAREAANAVAAAEAAKSPKAVLDTLKATYDTAVATLATSQVSAQRAEEESAATDFLRLEEAFATASKEAAVAAALDDKLVPPAKVTGGYKGVIDAKFAAMGLGATADKLPLSAYMMSGAPAMQYFDHTDLPFYYELAATFPIGDHYFSPVLGPTFINRNYLYGATSRSMTYNNAATGLGAADAVVNADEDKGSLIELLEANGISHDFFVSNHTSLGVANPYRYGSWLGLTDRFKAIVGKSHHDFFDLAKRGNLPAVSFVDADIAETAYGEDEHPPGDVQIGQHLAWEVVRAVMTSPDWDKTALFITYDENGGYADHLKPPAACEPGTSNQTFGGFYAGADQAASRKWKDDFDQYGIRVPFYVVSPFAKPGGYVSKKTYDHTSIVRFVREVLSTDAKPLRWLTKRDRAADPLLDFFDFDANFGKGAFAGLPANSFRHTYAKEDALIPTLPRVPSVPYHKIRQIPIFSRGPYTEPEEIAATAKANTVAENWAIAPFPEPQVDLSKYLICQALLSGENKYAASVPSAADAEASLADLPTTPEP